VIVSPSGDVSCPSLPPSAPAFDAAVSAKPLGLARLHAAVGVTCDEASAAGA